jgi:hypothetical protein
MIKVKSQKLKVKCKENFSFTVDEVNPLHILLLCRDGLWNEMNTLQHATGKNP